LKDRIRFLDLSLPSDVKKECIEQITSVIANGNYILGHEVRKFEKSISEKIGVKYVLGVNSGFSALYLSLLAMGIKSNDEVVTVGNSFVATVAAVQLLGAKVVYCEVGDDRNMCIESLKKAVTKKTKVIIPVHLAGIPASMLEIMEFAQKKGIYVVEDSSQAFGAKLNDKYVGTWGDIGCFSMHPTKNLGAFGDAGFLVTDNEELYKKVWLLRNHGLLDRDHCECFGFNSRLDEVQAAILNVKLKYVDQWNKRRNEIACIYRDNLTDLNLQLPLVRGNCYCVYFGYVIQTDQRDALKDYLEANNIECRIHYPIPIHKQKASIDAFGNWELPKTDMQNKRILSLPIYPSLTDSDIYKIIFHIKEFFKGVRINGC
jgi:dTDP-4-amino-4,6-dideoxygalactose transaminase